MTRFTLATLAMLVLTACGDSTGPKQDDIEGVYTLKTAAGMSLPAQFPVQGLGQLVITGGSVTLKADRTFTARLDLRITENGQTTEVSAPGSGTYQRTNGTILLKNSDGTEDKATIEGRTLTLNAEGVVLVFER